MYSGVYLALFALAAAATYIYVCREQSVEFTSAVASATWSLLAVTGGSIEVVSGGDITVIEVGPAQYLFAGLALLSFIAFVGSIIGWYPTDPELHHDDFNTRQ